MATINELLKEIDWDLYDDSDYEEDDRNMPSDELILDNSSDKPVGQRRAELIIQSRMNIAARAKIIRREAADDDLTALVSRRQLNELIRIITLPDTEAIERLWRLMNKHATTALSPFIPVDLIRSYNKYKKVSSTIIPRTPGFIYKAPIEWGHHYDLWLTPDLPCYIPQFTEQELIIKYKPEKKEIIDRHIVSYFKAIQSRAKLEMSLATRLYNICTRYDLLVKNADFYKLYMDNKLFNF